MNITGETKAQGTGGGQVKSASPNVYTNVPVTYKKNRQGMSLTAGEQRIEIGNFLLEFPVYQNGIRINLNENVKLKILARGLEPEKTFRIVGKPFDNQGILYEVEARME